RLGPLQQLGVGNEFFQLVALQGVLLDPLDGSLREEGVNGVDPLGHQELRLPQSARPLARRSDVAAGPVLPVVEEAQGLVALGPAPLQRAAQGFLGSSAQDQSPARQARALVHAFPPRSPYRSAAANSCASKARAWAAASGGISSAASGFTLLIPRA